MKLSRHMMEALKSNPFNVVSICEQHNIDDENFIHDSVLPIVTEVILSSIDKSVTSHRLWSEYVNECQHQDGLSYWQNFENVTEIKEDFELYVQFEEENEEEIDDTEEHYIGDDQDPEFDSLFDNGFFDED